MKKSIHAMLATLQRRKNFIMWPQDLTLKKACCNDFGRISSEFNTSIEALKEIGTILSTNKIEKDTIDYAFETMRCEIRQLAGEKTGKGTVKSYYYVKRDPKFRIAMLINR